MRSAKQQANVDQALAMLVDLATGKLDRNRFSSDATWWSNTGQSFSLDAFQQLLDVLHAATIGGIVTKTGLIIAQADSVVIEGTSDVPLTSGRRYTNRYLFLIHVRHGRISEVREYNDTAHVFDVFNLGSQ